MNTLRVVLADDHEVVRAGLRALVEATPGMEVVGEAKDGESACEQAEGLRPDVVVIDVSMPEVDGVQATERIRRTCPGVQVIGLTMYDDRAHLSRLLQAGAAGYVLKGSAAAELVRAIRIVGDGGTYVDPQLSGRVLARSARRNAGVPDGSPESLSDREEEVLRGLAWGHSNKELGRQLGISTKTVETYRARIATKLGIRSRSDIVRYAVQQGWLSEV